ncbi:MAG: toll/interleukin-1 receptor domain-containing protein [Candidatus Riflebacteria bacterium]|nr:toll/interleukin-1 receptor domain-containing protein [Candidatus Riflebacteria bacterium]
MGNTLTDLKDELARSLNEQSERWFRERISTGNTDPDLPWLCKARDRVYWSAGETVRALQMTEDTPLADFYTAVLGAVGACAPADGAEYWPDNIMKMAMAEVTEFIAARVPAEYRAEHSRAMSERGRVRLFLSFSSKDSTAVEKLGQALRQLGIHVSYDASDDPRHFRDVPRATESDVLCVVLSKTSVATRWVQFDVRKAVERDVAGRMRILAIRLDDCPEPEYLRHLRQPTLCLGHGEPEAVEELARSIVAALDGPWKTT